MTEIEFLKKRKSLLKRKEKFQEKLDKEYTDYVNAYIDANFPVEKLKVYELEPGKRPYRKGFKRFVIYDRSLQFFGDCPIMRAGGWWLDEQNVPAKWDTITVGNIANPTIFVLSEDQTALPNPDSKD